MKTNLFKKREEWLFCIFASLFIRLNGRQLGSPIGFCIQSVWKPLENSIQHIEPNKSEKDNTSES